MKLDRITTNPARMNGQPCLRNLRLTVRRVVELAATYPDRVELRREFPELEDEDIRQALLASKIVSYAQGFMLLREAAKEYHWKLNYGAIAMVWREGCIIRSAFLGKIKAAFDHNPELTNLLLDDLDKELEHRTP